MEFKKHHFYILLIILAFGGFLNLSKKRGSLGVTQDAQLKGALNIDETPYVRPADDTEELDTEEDEDQSFHYPESNTFSHPVGERGLVMPAKADDKKKDEKKKKKKKKKDASVALPAPQLPMPTHELPKINPQQPPGQAGSNNPSAKTNPPAAAPTSAGTTSYNQTANQASEWERRLLNQPDAAAAAAFLKAYKAGSVTSAVFYKLLQSMLTDSRQEMQTLAVTTLGGIQSVQSFNLLAGALKQAGPVATAAQAQIAKYQTMGNLKILETVLRTGGPVEGDIQAITLVGKLATQAGTNTQTSGQTPTTVNTSSFVPFKDLLTRLSTGTTAVATSAQTALQAVLLVLKA